VYQDEGVVARSEPVEGPSTSFLANCSAIRSNIGGMVGAATGGTVGDPREIASILPTQPLETALVELGVRCTAVQALK
jgi:hypothetical protein